MVMNDFEHGVDYEYIVNDKDLNSVHIKLLTGQYKDTVYKYGKIKFEETDENLHLQFNFNVIESPIKKIEKTVEFRNYIGDVLSSIIRGNIGLEESYYDENRTDDIKESDLP